MKGFNSFSLESKYPILISFFSGLNKFSYLNPGKEKQKQKESVYNNVSELYNDYDPSKC